MKRIIFLICLIINLDLFVAYEFGDRIKTSKNSVESGERNRKSQPTFHTSPNAPERNVEEIVLDDGIFELLDEGKNLSDALEFDGNKDSGVQFYPINDFIDVTTDVIAEVREKQRPSANFEVPRDKNGDKKFGSEIELEIGDDMLSSSSDNVFQIEKNKEKVQWKREDNWKGKESKKENLENLNKKKVVTSYVNFGPKLSALKAPYPSTRQTPTGSKTKYAFRRINDNKDSTESTKEETSGREDTNKTDDDQMNAEAHSKGDRNQSMTKSNKPANRIRDKVKYVEVTRDKGTTKYDNAEIKRPADNDASLWTASNSDDVSSVVTPEPPVTTFASFHYFTKNNINNSAQNPDIRLTARNSDKDFLSNKGIANIKISEKSRNTFYLINENQSVQLPTSIGEKKVITNPSEVLNLKPGHQQSPNPVNFSRQSQPPLQHFSAPPTLHSELESNLATEDEDNTKVYNDILDSTKSIIQKAKLQFHMQDTISVPHKYLQPPRITDNGGETVSDNFDNQSDFQNFASSSTISKTMVPPPRRSIFHASSNVSPSFTLSPTNENLYREDLAESDSTSARIWPLWRQQIEHDEEPDVKASNEVRYTLVDSNVSNGPEDNYGEFSENKNITPQNSTRPTAVAFTTSELQAPTKSFLYDRPNNFHTSFEDYLETHGIFGTKFSNEIPGKPLNSNKVEQRENFNKHGYGAQGTYSKAVSELRNLVPIPTFKTADKSHQVAKKGNTFVDGNKALNVKSNPNLKEKQLLPNNKISASDISVDSKSAVNSPDSLSESANLISSSANPEGSVRQVQQQQEMTNPQNSIAISQTLQHTRNHEGLHVNQSPKFKVNPPVLNTIQKRPQNIRSKPINNPHFLPPRPSFSSFHRVQSRGKEKRPPSHPRLALSKFLQPPPPLSHEVENEADNSVLSDVQTNTPNVQPGNLTAYFRTNQQIPVPSSTYTPIGSSSNHAPLVFNYNPLSQVPNYHQIQLPSSSKHLTHYYLPNQFQMEYQIPSKPNFLQYQPDVKVKDLLPEGKLRAPDVDNSIAHSIKVQENQPLTSINSNYSPSIASHVRGNTPSYQNEFTYTLPSFPTHGPPLRPPFYPTKAPSHQHLHKMPSKRHRPKLFLGYNPFSYASSNVNPIRYRPPRIFPPMFGRATHFHESNEIVNPFKDKQSSHFKVIRETEEDAANGLSGKANVNPPAYQQFEILPPRKNQNNVKPFSVFDNLVASESVSVPIKVQTNLNPNNYKNPNLNQGSSQPLPKEIMRKRDSKVPESHLSMLRSLKYGIHGEPLDVWIPIKSSEEK